MTTTSTRSIEQAEVIRGRSENTWKYLVGIAAALTVALVIVALIAASNEPTRDLTSGFDYNDETTSARIAMNEPVTGQYFGYTDELWPAKDRTTGFDTDDDTTRGIGRTGEPIQRLYFGYSAELNADH